MNDWVRARAAEFEALKGLEVTRWRGREMALREIGPNGSPQFRDPEVPFVQLLVLRLEFRGKPAQEIATYQDDDEWGLFPRSALTESFGSDDGIFRTVTLPTLPLGLITQVDVTYNPRDNISQVTFAFDNLEILLVAGEADELGDGGLRFILDDESVLLFTSLADFESIEWYRPSS